MDSLNMIQNSNFIPNQIMVVHIILIHIMVPSMDFKNQKIKGNIVVHLKEHIKQQNASIYLVF